MRTPILLHLREWEGEAGFLQELAGQTLWSARPLLPEARPASRPRRSSTGGSSEWRIVYDGPGLVEGRIQRIVSSRAPDGTRQVAYEDGEVFQVDADGGEILHLRGPADRAADRRSLERALGAPFALALAPRGIYLLHASGVAIEGVALALAAPSGGGKSTLAAAAARNGLARLADDQLPVRLGRTPAVLPRFPQLKLGPGENYPPQAPEEIRFGALVEIEHSPATEEAAIDRLPTGAAALALTRATVAARLFDEELLAAHFTACAEAAERVAVARLTFPSGVDRLPGALAALGELANRLA